LRGIEGVLHVIDYTEGNTVSYALKALGVALAYEIIFVFLIFYTSYLLRLFTIFLLPNFVLSRYLNALEYLKQRPEVLQKLFELIFRPNINVCRIALSLVFVVRYLPTTVTI